MGADCWLASLVHWRRLVQALTQQTGVIFVAFSSLLRNNFDESSLAIQKMYEPLVGGTTKVRKRCP